LQLHLTEHLKLTMKFLILASLFVLSVFAEPEAEADAQWYNLNRGYGGYYPMSYGYNSYNSYNNYNGYNNYNSYNRYNMYNRNMWGQMRFVREAEAEPKDDPKLTPHHTSGYVKYNSGAIVPEDTASVKLAKAQHHEAHQERLENENDQSEEDVFGEDGRQPARPLRHYIQLFKNTQTPVTYNQKVQVQTPAHIYAINPFYHVYQPRVYGYAPVVYQNNAKPYSYYAHSAGVVHAVAKREAEAEPEADAQYYNWNRGYGYYPNSMNYGYSGYPYNRYNNYNSYNRNSFNGYNRNYNSFNGYNRNFNYNSFNGYYRY